MIKGSNAKLVEEDGNMGRLKTPKVIPKWINSQHIQRGKWKGFDLKEFVSTQGLSVT